RRSRCAEAISPPTTAPSTSRSARTSTASRARRSTSAVARTWSARCLSRRRRPRRSRDARPCGCDARRVRSAPWARSRPRPRSSAGWCATRSTCSRRRSRGRAMSSSTASPPRSRHPSRSRSPRRRCARASSSSMATETRTSRKRLPPEIFDLPVEKMREGYYTDAYFNFARETLRADGRHPRVVLQVFQKKQAVLGGMDEAIAVLKLCADDWDALTVHALYDGDEIEPWETVLTIEGEYPLFAHLETVYLGVLARRTLISTNVRGVVQAAAGKPILFFPARHDHHRVQTGDGYAAHVAGAIGVSTDAQA